VLATKYQQNQDVDGKQGLQEIATGANPAVVAIGC
jgi:hypothetical protein